MKIAAGRETRTWLTRQTLSWAMFDVMSSVYFGIVPSVAFPIYFQHFAVGDVDPNQAWGLLVAVGVAASGLAALLSAALSRHVLRAYVLMIMTFGLVACLAMLATETSHGLWILSVGYVAAQCFYFAATTAYESYLPEITHGGSVGRVSGFGWALGYVGGIVAVIVLLVAVGPLPDSPEKFQRVFAIVAVLTVVFAIPVFTNGIWWLKPDAQANDGGFRWIGLVEIARYWRSYRHVLVLLVAISLIQGVTVFVVAFTAPLLTRSFGQSLDDLLWLLLVLQVLSIPTTLVFSTFIDSRLRGSSVFIVLSGWAAILLLLAFATAPWVPWAIVGILSCCLGATNAAMRSFLAEAVPGNQAIAFFGLSTFLGRISSALGPLVFVGVSWAAGERAALMAIIAMLALGGAMLGRLLAR